MLPVGVLLGAEVTKSISSLPGKAPNGNGAVNGITMSNGHGPGAGHPGELNEAGPLYTTTASGPVLFANVVLGKVWPPLVFGKACVVESVIFRFAYCTLIGPVPAADRTRMPVITIGVINSANWPPPTTS